MSSCVCVKMRVCEINETMQKCVEVKNLFTYQEESFLLLGMFQFTCASDDLNKSYL